MPALISFCFHPAKGVPATPGIDLTDAEWRVIAPHLPKPRSKGRPRA